jgi:8-oxo-dGTP diphosphatase
LNTPTSELRNKLDYSNVGFELLPEKFTLTELQLVHEAILGESLDKRNFRRKILQTGHCRAQQRVAENWSQARPAISLC